MAVMSNIVPARGSRMQIPPHPLGLTHVEHTAASTLQPEETAQFYLQVLGCALQIAHGYSEEERRVGRMRHLFMFMGDSRMQLGVPYDRQTVPDPAGTSPWPHWAFAASPPALEAACDRLAANGIPYSGPWTHHDTEEVSVYLQDPVGNKLEIVTREPVSRQAVGVLPYDAGVDWPSLRHDWQARGGGILPITRNASTRPAAPPNLYGLGGLDHVALPSRDPEGNMEFYLQLMGGTLFSTSGYSQDDARAGRPREVAMHIGRTVVKLGEPTDGVSFPDPDYQGWNHWAWDCSAEVLQAMDRRLREQGVPVSGPWRHMGSDGIGIYFSDPEGNHLEIRTSEPLPADRTKVAGKEGRPEHLPNPWRPAA